MYSRFEKMNVLLTSKPVEDTWRTPCRRQHCGVGRRSFHVCSFKSSHVCSFKSFHICSFKASIRSGYLEPPPLSHHPTLPPTPTVEMKTKQNPGNQARPPDTTANFPPSRFSSLPASGYLCPATREFGILIKKINCKKCTFACTYITACDDVACVLFSELVELVKRLPFLNVSFPQVLFVV